MNIQVERDYDVKNRPNKIRNNQYDNYNHHHDNRYNQRNDDRYYYERNNNENRNSSDDYYNDNYSDRRYYDSRDDYCYPSSRKTENIRKNYNKNTPSSPKINNERSNAIDRSYSKSPNKKIGTDSTCNFSDTNLKDDNNNIIDPPTKTNNETTLNKFNNSLDGLPIELNTPNQTIQTTNNNIETSLSSNAPQPTASTIPIPNNNIPVSKDLISSIIDRNICKKNLEDANKISNSITNNINTTTNTTNNIPSKINIRLNKSLELKSSIENNNSAKSEDSNLTKKIIHPINTNNNQINNINRGNTKTNTTPATNINLNSNEFPTKLRITTPQETDKIRSRRNSLDKKKPLKLVAPPSQRKLAKSQDLVFKRVETKVKGVPLKKLPPLKKEPPIVKKRKEVNKEGRDLLSLRKKMVRREGDKGEEEETDPWRDVRKALPPKNREIEMRDQKMDFKTTKDPRDLHTTQPKENVKETRNSKDTKTTAPNNPNTTNETKKNYAKKEASVQVPKKEHPTPTTTGTTKKTSSTSKTSSIKNSSTRLPPLKKETIKLENISERKRVHSYALTNSQLKSYKERGFVLVKGMGLSDKNDLSLENLSAALKEGEELPHAIYGGYVGSLELDCKSVKMENSGKILPIEYFIHYVHCDLLNGKNTTMNTLNACYFLFKNQKKMMNAETLIELYLKKKQNVNINVDNNSFKKIKQEKGGFFENENEIKDEDEGSSYESRDFKSYSESDSDIEYESSAVSPKRKKSNSMKKTTQSKKEGESDESPLKKPKTKVSSSKMKNTICTSSNDNDMLRIELKKPKHNETIHLSLSGQDNSSLNKKDTSFLNSNVDNNFVSSSLHNHLFNKKDSLEKSLPSEKDLIQNQPSGVFIEEKHLNHSSKDPFLSKSLDEISLHQKDPLPNDPLNVKSLDNISLNNDPFRVNRNPLSPSLSNKEDPLLQNKDLPVLNKEDPLNQSKDFLSDFDETSRKFWRENFKNLKFVSWDKFFPVLSNALVDISGIEDSQAKVIAQNMKPKLVSKFDTVGTHNLKSALNGSDFLSFIQNELQNVDMI
eukprot:TRINITY_DN3519_c0_g1_i1.p1 TRINITY_DN3519_c0_g1~~TRINITY_DN3519_c0_g1_i1.p1  ORF type:complete len:1079 (-),score=352.41 TRINITY_DN3519_c0_g1_i1:31-3189(-)